MTIDNQTKDSCHAIGCCSQTENNQKMGQHKWIIGRIKTSEGFIPQVSTRLTLSDQVGSFKSRWGINRMNYKIDPGLYAVGSPDADSPVLVTANYKLTFDAVRKELSEMHLWILVLDTKGVNVWCAAGKGTYGTQEIVRRLESVKLHQVVSHRILILPQLGAPGVCAGEISKATGFKATYGPVKAKDIKEFIHSGSQATTAMRTVQFTLRDRVVLIPMQLVGSIKQTVIVFGILFLLNIFAVIPFGRIDFYAYMGAWVTGCVITPVLLPWIMGRSFAWKGWLLGLIWALAFHVLNGWLQIPAYSVVRAIGYMLVLPSISSFYAMNFTGSSTYTSLSGVIKEMKIAVPIIIVSTSIGMILLLLNTYFEL